MNATTRGKLRNGIVSLLTLGSALCGSAFAEDADWTGEPDYFVSYIESTDGGRQWIDLGVNAASPIKAEMKMMWNTVPGDGTFIGARIDGGDRIYLAHAAKGLWGYGFGAWCQVGKQSISGPVAGRIYMVATEFRNGSQTMSVGDETSSAQTAADYDVGLNLYLFACNRGGTPDYFSHSRLYSLSVWQGDELKHVYSPCVKNGEACLYDKTTGDYFRNGGTAPLVAGPGPNVVMFDVHGGEGGTPSVNVFNGELMPSVTPPTREGFVFTGYFDDPESGTRYYMADGKGARIWDGTADTTLYAHWWSAAQPLPVGYTAVECIGSTSRVGQYIDTGYTHKANTRIECEVEVAADQPTGWRAIFGARKNSYSSNAFCFFSQDSNNHIRYNRSGNEADSGSSFPRGQRVSLRCAGDTAEWSVLGSGVTNSLTTTGTCDDGANTMFIFNLNTAEEGGKKADTSPCDMKLYSFRIYEGETLVCEYLPCLNDTFQAGLYETNEGVFHANMGDGEFDCSPDPRQTVNIPAHTKGGWTFGDGSKTNVIAGGAFHVLGGTTNVTVILTAKSPHYFADGSETKTVSLGTVSGTVSADDERYAGCETKFDSVRYIDANGDEQVCDNYEIVTAETSVLTGGWYLVVGTVSRGGIEVADGQAVNLILADGAALTTQGGDGQAGICVQPGESLTIYGQTEGTGRLTATGGSGGGAGIGGNDGAACGTVVINGGLVTATGGTGDWTSGIGGGGSWGAGGTVVINGGTVTARGRSLGAGIGAGGNVSDGSIVIRNGAISTTYDRGGTSFRCTSMAISGGIFAVPIQDSWCARGYGVFENPDPETKGEYPYAVLSKRIVTVDGVPDSVRVYWTSGDGSQTNALKGASFIVRPETSNVKVIFRVDPAYDYVSGELLCDLQTVTEDQTVTCRVLTRHRTTEYVDEDGVLRTTDAFAVVTADIVTMTGGWYLVEGTLSRGGLEVADEQSVNLILADGASLTVQGDGNRAGLNVGVGETLTIYGQRDGTGRLTANGGRCGAGIGGDAQICGNARSTCGTVVINRGVVTAKGGTEGAGIGGGFCGSGGMVMIRDGDVSVTAGLGASVIGHGGENYGDGKVSITGGIFAMPIQNSWLADKRTVEPNPDPQTKDDYPYVVLPCLYTVTVPAFEHVTSSAWTNGLEVVGFTGSLTLRQGSTVTVVFSPGPKYCIVANGEKSWVLEEDVVFGTTPGFPMPTVEGLPGSDVNPWQIGDNVTACTNGTNDLRIEGVGATRDFESAADVPWADFARQIAKVSVAETVTLGSNVLAGLDDAAVVSSTETIGALKSALGVSSEVPVGLISPAEFERIEIVGGKALLGVSVATNGDLTAATECWGKAKVEKAEVVDGEAVLTVPATTERGFMILKSKDAKISASRWTR